MDEGIARRRSMGHSSIKVTFDLSRHLMLGTKAEAAAL
jgi:hypothetical protein